MKAGEEFNIKPTGPSDIRRIEGAIFNWGADMTYENNPFELGLDRLWTWDRCRTTRDLDRGAEADPRRGRGRKIVGVEIDGEPFPALNNVKWPVTADGAEIGKVTSAIYSPRLKKNIGYAWVPTAVRRTRHVARRLQRMGTATPSSWRCRSSTRRSRSRWHSGTAFIVRWKRRPSGASSMFSPLMGPPERSRCHWALV